jgi:hypothetical protein
LQHSDAAKFDNLFSIENHVHKLSGIVASQTGTAKEHSMTDQLRSLVSLAAELRERGHSWEQVAAKVGRNQVTVRHWPIRYRPQWNEYRRDARDRLLLVDIGSRVAARLIAQYRQEQLRAKVLRRLREEEEQNEPRGSSDLVTAAGESNESSATARL